MTAQELEHQVFSLWINRLYYAQIAMNNESIKSVLKDISDTLHISEGSTYEDSLRNYLKISA